MLRFRPRPAPRERQATNGLHSALFRLSNFDLRRRQVGQGKFALIDLYPKIERRLWRSLSRYIDRTQRKGRCRPAAECSATRDFFPLWRLRTRERERTPQTHFPSNTFLLFLFFFPSLLGGCCCCGGGRKLGTNGNSNNALILVLLRIPRACACMYLSRSQSVLI